ncbi:MAG TPA: cytochrome c [Mucilaginibacter sp.]|jgi:mono/diheme cytochrome c family protein|nr:cytochrome c [Mucilaginibacter sp.]
MKFSAKTYLPAPCSKGCLISGAIFILSLISFVAAAQQKPWVSPMSARAVVNPLKGDKSAVTEGKSLYVTNCGPCHGGKGKGDGPAAAALAVKPADHSSAVVQSETDGSLYWKVTTGRTPMPSYKTPLTDKQRWELVDYIRTLAKKG